MEEATFESSSLQENWRTLAAGSEQALRHAAAVKYVAYIAENEKEEIRIKEWLDRTENFSQSDPASIPLQLEALEYEVMKLQDEIHEKNGLLEEYREALAVYKIMVSVHSKIKLYSIIGIAAFAFSLCIYWTSKILLVNPVFSLFGILACAVFWLMAKVDERRLLRR